METSNGVNKLDVKSEAVTPTTCSSIPLLFKKTITNTNVNIQNKPISPKDSNLSNNLVTQTNSQLVDDVNNAVQTKSIGFHYETASTNNTSTGFDTVRPGRSSFSQLKSNGNDHQPPIDGSNYIQSWMGQTSILNRDELKDNAIFPTPNCFSSINDHQNSNSSSKLDSIDHLSELDSTNSMMECSSLILPPPPGPWNSDSIGINNHTHGTMSDEFSSISTKSELNNLTNQFLRQLLVSDSLGTWTNRDDHSYALSSLDSDLIDWMRLNVRDVTHEQVKDAKIMDLDSYPRSHVHHWVDLFNLNPSGLRLNFVSWKILFEIGPIGFLFRI